CERADDASARRSLPRFTRAAQDTARRKELAGGSTGHWRNRTPHPVAQHDAIYNGAQRRRVRIVEGARRQLVHSTSCARHAAARRSAATAAPRERILSGAVAVDEIRTG